MSVDFATTYWTVNSFQYSLIFARSLQAGKSCSSFSADIGAQRSAVNASSVE